MNRMHNPRNKRWVSNPSGKRRHPLSWRSDDQREKKRLYQQKVRARRKALGLTTKGTPVKQPDHYMRTTSRPAYRWSPRQRRKFARTMKKVWRRKQQGEAQTESPAQLNERHNSHKPPTPQPTNAAAFDYGMAADAIISAANVLRAVRVGMKVTHQV
jgi:hypothetical protein